MNLKLIETVLSSYKGDLIKIKNFLDKCSSDTIEENLLDSCFHIGKLQVRYEYWKNRDLVVQSRRFGGVSYNIFKFVDINEEDLSDLKAYGQSVKYIADFKEQVDMIINYVVPL